MTTDSDRTRWRGIAFGVAGFALLYIGLSDYLLEPGFEPVVTGALGLLGLLMARQELLGVSRETKRWTGIALAALITLWILPGLVHGLRTNSVVVWIVAATLGAILLIAVVAGVLRLRRKEANRA